jgi:hypothetical protein
MRSLLTKFRAALNKEVARGIVTPGFGDKPLIAHSNMGRLFLQFKSFLLASTQRTLLSGMQGRPLWLAMQLSVTTAVGMFIAYIKLAERKGWDEADKYLDNPGRWVTDGVDRGGMFPLVFELTNTLDRMLGVPTPSDVVSRAVGDDRDMSADTRRFSNRNAAGTLGGPTAGLVQDLSNVAGQLGQQVLTGEGVKNSGINSMVRITPGARLPYTRWVIENQFKDVARDTFDVEEPRQ